MTPDFLAARITATQAQILAHEDAISGLSKPDVFSYTLDTGQTRQTVTRQSLSALQKTLDALYNRLAILEARRNGAGTIMRPGF